MNRIKERDTDRGELMMDPQLAGRVTDCDGAGDHLYRDGSGDDWMLEHQDLEHQDLDLDLNGDRLREECGVFGIYGHPDAAAITALGLHALQHRGQEAAGIVSYDGRRFHSERRPGLVGDTFSRREIIDRLPGMSAVGHVRYSTTGETILRNVQPLFAELDGGGFAVGHNGNLTNGLTLRRELVRNGAMMQSTTDTEVILHLVAQSKRNRFIDRFIEALRAIEGANSLVSLTNKKLIGARDPLGIRPLVLGELDGCPILASETFAPMMSSPAKSSCSTSRARKAINRFRQSRRGPASSSTSTFRGRIPSSAGDPCMKSARRLAPSSRVKAMSRSMSWCRCRIPACLQPSATVSIPGCRSSLASSATIMSAAPSFSRPRACANSACA